MAALSQAQIDALLSDTRGRGDYGVFLTNFVDSGEGGLEVDLKNGILAGKTIEKAKVGLNNAIKSRDKDGNLRFPKAQNVVVVNPKDSGKLFIINKGAMAGSEGSNES